MWSGIGTIQYKWACMPFGGAHSLEVEGGWGGPKASRYAEPTQETIQQTGGMLARKALGRVLKKGSRQAKTFQIFR